MEKTPHIHIPEGFPISDFVKMVGDILKEGYGTHLFERFQEELKKDLAD